MIKVLIADDHQLFRQGVASMLGEFPQLTIVGEAQNGKEVLDFIEKKVPDVVLLDIEMPVVDGFEVLKTLRKKTIKPKVLVLTMHNSNTFIKNIVAAGADGYLKKDSDKDTLEKAIQNVYATGSYFPNEVSQIVLESLREKTKQTSLITLREKEVVQLITEGLTTKQIANKLFLSKHTIESHRQNILLKLDLKNSAELVKYALKKGWV